MRKFIAVLKMIAFAVVSLLTIPPQWILLLFYRGKYAYIMPHIWMRLVCVIFGIRVEKLGQPYKESQVLYMSNHLSYLDIPAISSLICYGSFVAKKDVAKWPVFGFLSTLQQTAFISRSRGDAKKEANALDNMLQSGKNLVIFPEGTSTDGREVLDFKSSLFSIAFQEGLDDLKIQPVTVQMKTVDGQVPDTQDIRDIYAWHRDMDTELPEHLWRFAQSRGAVIQITFHDIISVNDHADRKTLAKASHIAVSNGLNLNAKEITKAA